MHHRRHHEAELVLTEGKGIALLHDELPLLRDRQREELSDHLEGFCIAHDRRLRVLLECLSDKCAVIRLHVVHDEIVKCTAIERRRHVLEELPRYSRIRGIEERGLLVPDHIGVIGHAAIQRENVLKQMQATILDTYINDIICNISNRIHGSLSFYRCFQHRIAEFKSDHRQNNNDYRFEI